MCSEDNQNTENKIVETEDTPKLTWKQKVKRFLTRDFNIKEESNQKVAAAIAIGVLVGILPIWGFQMVVGVAIAQFFGLNRLLVLAVSNISMPPMIIGILYESYQCGRLFFRDAPSISMDNATLDNVLSSGMCYIVGSVTFAIISAVIVYVISFLLLHLLRRKTQQQ